MGDDCNVRTTRRSADPSPLQSPSPRASIKDYEECLIRGREITAEERGSLLPSKPESGEPDERLLGISHDKHGLGLHLHQGEASVPVLPVAFPETKLRPDAPPFTPSPLHSLARGGPPPPHGLDDLAGVLSGFAPPGDPEIDESCFVNVDLREVRSRGEPLVSSAPAPLLGDSRDQIKDPGLKPFTLSSVPRFERSSPKIELSVESLCPHLRITEVATGVATGVATEAAANEPDTTQNEAHFGEPRASRGRWRILGRAFVIGNRIQIAVFLASLVLCAIIVAYVFV